MEIPEYVKANLAYALDHETEDYERFGQVISDISARWGI